MSGFTSRRVITCERRKAEDPRHHFLFTPAPGAAAGAGTAQGSARLLLQVGTAWGQPELLPPLMVGDCSPQLPGSNCKPVAFGMIQMNGVQVYSHQCQLRAMLRFASVRGDLLVQHVQLDREAGSVMPFCSASGTKGRGTCQVLVPSVPVHCPITPAFSQLQITLSPRFALSWAFFAPDALMNT